MMSMDNALAAGAPPITAILRGIRTEECVAVSQALIDAGIGIIEVPFNSPDPVGSIRAMAAAFGDHTAIGGGTVTDTAIADALHGAGGTFMVSPNIDTQVISHAIALGMGVLPGFLTPSEAFTAYGAGARDLKLFPGAALGSGYIKAIREVLPRDARVWAVGGVGPANIAEYRAAGVFGIGVGGSLYRPGDAAETVGAKARELVAAWRA